MHLNISSCISSSASSSEGPSNHEGFLPETGRGNAVWNFTLLVRMNSSLISPPRDTEVRYDKLFKMDAPWLDEEYSLLHSISPPQPHLRLLQAAIRSISLRKNNISETGNWRLSRRKRKSLHSYRLRVSGPASDDPFEHYKCCPDPLERNASGWVWSRDWSWTNMTDLIGTWDTGKGSIISPTGSHAAWP